MKSVNSQIFSQGKTIFYFNPTYRVNPMKSPFLLVKSHSNPMKSPFLGEITLFFPTVFLPESQRVAEVLGALLRGEAPEQVAKFVATRVHLEVGNVGNGNHPDFLLGISMNFPLQSLGFHGIFHLQQ